MISPSSACSGSFSAFSGVFIAEGTGGLGDKGSKDKTVDVQTLSEEFSNTSLQSACFSDEDVIW
jgi:hypothetical protein